MTGADKEARSPAALLDLLDAARTAGFLGPGPLDLQLRHAEGFATVARGLTGTVESVAAPSRSAVAAGTRPKVVDLGSGGGLPGLVVAWLWTEVDLALLESAGRRAAFLRRSVDRLGLAGRVSVLEGRAEDFGRQEGLRGAFDGALARSFGKPAVVAECAAPLLRVGAWLVVSEPPGGSEEAEAAGAMGAEDRHKERWPAADLAPLGLRPEGPVRADFEYQTLRQVSACPGRFPRRNGVPAKKPLF